MKKSLVIILAAVLVAAVSCKNINKKTFEVSKAEPETIDYGDKKKVAEELVKVEFQTFVESAAKIKPAPFASAKKDGRITLTAKEKLVKPGYLLDTKATKDLVTFSQKYRAISMLAVDKVIADLYEIPGNAYNNAILNLLADLGDEAISTFASTPWIDLETSKDAMKNLAEDEYNAGRQGYFWEGVAALLIEQVYVITRDVDKFMPMFDDASASEMTYNFVCLHEGIKSVVSLNPEMESLNKSLDILYKINAISVVQLRDQLNEIKDDIVPVRENLLK